jgi:DNA helicase-2/ATP-dependent DNA helicase PcrA
MHNAQQLQAINSNARTIVVVAGPGSGKTATTVARIQRLITEGVDPRGIVALTFTNNAARELEERLEIHLNDHGQQVDADCGTRTDSRIPNLGYCGTLHGFALRMLKQHGTALGYGDRMAIIDPDASADLLQSKADTLGCRMKPSELQKWKTTYKRPTGRPCLADTVVAAYFEDLRETGLVDFDIMLGEFLRMLVENVPFDSSPTPDKAIGATFTHLFVDEAQDSSSTDWAIYRALPMPNKFYVGDPDQAIYSFRGGKVAEFLAFAKDPANELIYLDTNYRSHAEICSAANNLIAHNSTRLEKHTISAKGPGGYIDITGKVPNLGLIANEGEEMAHVIHLMRQRRDDPDETSVAVLTRTNAIAYEYRKALKAANIPVKEAPAPTMPKDWQMARALLALLVQPDNDMLAYFYLITKETNYGVMPAAARRKAHAARMEAAAAGQSINHSIGWHFTQERSPGSTNVAQILAEHHYSLETRMIIAGKIKELGPNATLIELSLALADTRTAEPTEQITDPRAVNVTTIHGAKGLEFDTVYLVGMEQEAIPGTRKNAPADAVEEERRLAYVAITRARKTLIVRWCEQRKTEWGSIAQRTASQFLTEMLK